MFLSKIHGLTVIIVFTAFVSLQTCVAQTSVRLTEDPGRGVTVSDSPITPSIPSDEIPNSEPQSDPQLPSDPQQPSEPTIDNSVTNTSNCGQSGWWCYDGGWYCSLDNSPNQTLCGAQPMYPCPPACNVQGECFDTNTLLTLADGTKKKVEDIDVGEKVLNPVTGRSMKVVRTIERLESESLIELGYDSYRLHVTQPHPVKTSKGVKRASKLDLNDFVLGDDNKFHQLTILRQLPANPQTVKNFEFHGHSNKPDDHMVLSDGIVTGDLILSLHVLAKK